MIVHVKMEFDLDTETRRTTNVTPQVILAEQAHMCRYPSCAKPIPLTLTYCNTACFRAHGSRHRKPKTVLLGLTAPTTEAPPTPALPAIVSAEPPNYRSFTFPQGGLV